MGINALLMERNRICERNIINRIALMIGCVALSLLFMGMRVFASEVTPMTQTGYTTSDLNVRSGPGKDFDIIGTLRNGDVVNITGQTSTGWYQISFEGSEGFASNQYIVIGEMENESEPTEDEVDDSYIDNNKETKDKYVSQRTIKAVKLIGIVVVIVIILIMIAFTMKGIQNDEELYDDFDDDLLEYSREHQKSRKTTSSNKNNQKKKTSSGEVKKKEPVVVKETKPVKEVSEPIVIREEDYQLHIDPSIFEEENKIPQPERVNEEVSREELDRAMKKLNELQEEIDRLKKEQGK